ncbi:unnamed protein product [Cylindrotheca closterium]|uniref:Uncharacterized protein n=1 Tax=Cylindrotheca closterium TaxID=2856 RepID=A0AAD2FJP5_9STRA|nr:unnamed protein product [Cylindrotheca closterium]
MKSSSKYILCSIVLLLGSANGERSYDNGSRRGGFSSSWNHNIESYLLGRSEDSVTTVTTQKQKLRRRNKTEQQQQKSFYEVIGKRRVLKSSKRSSSFSSSKSSKKSKRSAHHHPMQKITTTATTPRPATARPTSQPTPPATPTPTAVADDDDAEAGDGTSITFGPGEIRYPLVDEEETKYGIGVHSKAPTVDDASQAATLVPQPLPTAPPTHHPLLKPLDRIDAFTKFAPTVSPERDTTTTLSPTVYLFRDRNHHAAFQTESLNFEKDPFVGKMMAMGDNGGVDPDDHQSFEDNPSVLVLLGNEDETSDNPAEMPSNTEILSGSSHNSSSCRSSLCSARTVSNQNHYCCNPAECLQKEVIDPAPSFRFGDWKTTVYTNLTMLYFVDVFGYTETTWDMPGTNPIEHLSFLDIHDQELLAYMGMSSFQYDCWINHYQSYSWNELECYGLAAEYTTLGWDADSWGSIHSTKWTLKEEKEWGDLTPAEQDAARSLCYFPELWNGTPLGDWNEGWLDGAKNHDRAYASQPETEVEVGGSVSPTPKPSDQPTLSPSMALYSSDSDEPSSGPTTKETESMAPSDMDSDMPSTFPITIASMPPSELASEGPSSYSASPTIESIESINSDDSCLSSACSIRTPGNEGQFCCGADTCDRKSIVLPIPTFRWNSWDALDDSLRSAARDLGYTEDLWNHPGAYELERWSFGFLSTSNQQKIMDLGFTPQTWDCWQNHYQDYRWEELSCFGLVWAAEALGWEGTTWSNDTAPLVVQKDWSSLSSQERSAARELCYLPALWEHAPLDEWDD